MTAVGILISHRGTSETMTRCIRCRCIYRELPDEYGDHDCPRCGLTPEQRERWFEDGEEEEPEDA